MSTASVYITCGRIFDSCLNIASASIILGEKDN